MKKKLLLIPLLIVILGLAFVLNIPGRAVEADELKTVYAKALSGHGCDSGEWHFVINQIDDEANAPSSIHVKWANSSSENITLQKFTGKVAHYATTKNLNSTVKEASAQIYVEWNGQFNLSHGPCREEITPTPRNGKTPTPPTETPTPPPFCPTDPCCEPAEDGFVFGWPDGNVFLFHAEDRTCVISVPKGDLICWPTCCGCECP